MSSSAGFMDVGGAGSGGGGRLSFCCVRHRLSDSGWSSLSVQGSESERWRGLGLLAGASDAKLDEPLSEGGKAATAGLLRVRTGDIEEM